MSTDPGNSAAHSGNATVLVVDDDHDMVSALCDILRQAGYNSLGAHSGNEALAIVDHLNRKSHVRSQSCHSLPDMASTSRENRNTRKAARNMGESPSVCFRCSIWLDSPRKSVLPRLW